MTKTASIGLWSAASVILLVAAMSAWRFAPELAVEYSSNAYTATLCVRSFAIALAAGAQVLLLTCVVGRLYPTRLPDKLFSAAFGLASVAALGASLALGWSSR